MTGDVSDPLVPIDVVAAVLVDNLSAPTRLLAGRRTEPEYLAGGWEIPGGKVDPGEDRATALRRELREELGVEIVCGARLSGPLPGGFWPLSKSYRLDVHLAAITAGEPQPLEGHDALRWLTLETVWTVPWLTTNVPIVAAALNRFSHDSWVDPSG